MKGGMNCAASSWRNHLGRHYIVSLLMIVVINELWLKDISLLCRWYLNDILAMPLLLTYSAFLAELEGFTMSRAGAWGLCVACVVAWEIVGPLAFSFSTADPLDAAAYVAGTWIWVREA